MERMSVSRVACAVALAAVAASGAPGRDDPVDFARDVRPLLARRCLACHGGIKREAGLSFAFRDDAFAPLADGLRAIVPGRPDQSELLRRVSTRDTEERMPPKGERLAAAEIETLRRWIAQGAPWRNHWAFEPPARPPLPQVRRSSWPRNGIDRFILARLEREGLEPSPEADRRTLARRVAFTLTGLPPDPREVESFACDPGPDAYERLVDRFLADPAYGGRWGKLWLDAAGYADSNGYFHADTDRPHAWRYRDWVIDAVAGDLPFDEFVRWQLAGDELAGYRPGADVTPDMLPKLAASHFLRNAPDGTGESDGNPEERQRDRLVVLEGNVQNLSSALLGLTTGCARCHDHPFEPIRQVEYYGLQAILAAAYPDDPKKWTKPQDRVVVAATKAEIDAHERASRPVRGEIKAVEEDLKKGAEEARARRVDEQVRRLGDEEQARAREALESKGDPKKVLGDLGIRTEYKDEELAAADPSFAARQKEAKQKIEALRKKLPPDLPKVAALVEMHAEVPPHRLKKRGVYIQPGEEAPPGVPASLGGEFRPGSRRTALADWITSPRHPLLSRVTVNRVWQFHFGTGLAATPENLGASGDPPSHPELVDWLAAEFIGGGWSLKALHRLILTSATFRQSGAARPRERAADPANRLLWRWTVRRLDAESVRDGMLAAAGILDPARGGPYVPTKRTEAAVVVDPGTPGARRRSVYLQQRRTQVLTFLGTFDAPDIASNCTRRASSTIPLQSLSLLNSEFSLACARGLGSRARKEGIPFAFLAATGRPPDPAESREAEEFLRSQREIYAGKKDAEERAWADFAQVLLASNGFLYLE
jgi:hypothetical protein